MRVLKRSTVITRIAHRRGPRQRVYNGDNREHGLEIVRLILTSWPRARGARIFEGSDIWEGLLRRKPRQRDKKTFIEAVACVDTALWDLVGKALGQSVSALLGGLPAAAAHHHHRGLLHAGQDARRHRPRDGEPSPGGYAPAEFKMGADYTRGGCRASRDGADGGETRFRPRVDANRGWSVAGRGALRPADRAARHPWFEEQRATGTTTWR